MGPDSADKPSVYFGDVITISPERWFVGRSAWWGFALASLGPAVIVVSVYRFHAAWADFWLWPVAVTGSVFLLVNTCRALRSVRFRRRLDLIDRTPPPTLRSLAWRLWQRALVERRGRLSFDAAAWLDAVGPAGPHTILLDVDLPDIPPATDMSEEVPIGMDGPIGGPEKSSRWMQVGLFGFNLIMIVFFAATWQRGQASRLWMAAVWAGFVAIALYRLGLRPISLGASSVAPGRLRVTRGTSTREFTREDSVLILQQAASTVVAWFFRRDGESTRIHFHSGENDPGLRLLVERWCWRPERREVVAGVPGHGRDSPVQE
jgi:hypothetical protein